MSDETDRLSSMSGDDEAAYYEALVKGEVGSSDEWEEGRCHRGAAETREEMRRLYDKAKAARTGERIRCPGCRKTIRKRSYQQKFCRSRGRGNCKDYYHNSVDHFRSLRAGGARLW